MMLRIRKGRAQEQAGSENGFTLVELMIALVIMGLIMSVVYKVFSSQERFFRNQGEVSAMQENLRATMEYINQEMSWLGYQVPGVSVVKAAPTDIIFKANIPNTGQTIQYVRYLFNPSTNSIERAAGATASDVNTLVVMASDIEALSFSYYNVLNGVLAVDPTDPPCAGELSTTACSPGTPGGSGGDSSLLMIQRVKARVTARTSRPDWLYTDPEDPSGPNANYRKRKAVLDLKARNVEDVTLQGGQIVVGSCGSLTHSITNASNYAACRDKTYQLANYLPDPSGTNWYDDNPVITVTALDANGDTNTDPNRLVYVSAVADDGTPYNIYDETTQVNNSIDTGETRYLAAQELSTVTSGTHVKLRFAYSDGLCTQVAYQGNTDVIVAPGGASQFLSLDAVGDPMVTTAFVTAGTASTISPQPTELAACSQAADMGVRLTMALADDCVNGITGETVAWSDNGAGGSFTARTDAGDGTYSALYIPPDNLSSVVSQESIVLAATWNAQTHPETVTLIPAAPHNIVIDSITEVSGSGSYLFDSSPAADNNSTFEIERVDGQLVRVSFHLEDECGNRVFGYNTGITPSAISGQVGDVVSEDSNGNISFTWKSNIGCGAAESGHTIIISSSDIANPPTATETVTFDLLETVSGPRLVLGASSPGQLYAGNTSDSVTIDARIEEYNEALQLCYNVPGPFNVAFVVVGDTATRSGSFSSSNHNMTATSTVTAADGTGSVELYPGTARWNDNLTVTATADVEGAYYSNTIGVGMLDSTVDETYSGFFPDTGYNVANKVGVTENDRSFDPGETIYIQVKDFDENESPLAQDSGASPWTSVKLTVERTGDVETVFLTEDLFNTALFRDAIDTQHAAVALSGDGVLQVLNGDKITMDYEDKDDPTDLGSWQVYTSGPQWMKLYRVEAGIDYDIFSGGIQVPDISYEDNIRVELFYPEFAADAASGSSTQSFVTDSGSDNDTVGIVEYADTGIFVIDNGTGLFRVTKNDPGDLTDQLYIQSTPRPVTVSWPDTVAPVIEQTFTMYDQDLPEVTITSPAAGIVAGTVLITVNASDPYNTTPSGGISRVDVYINDRLFDSVVGLDLSGDNTFDWVTVISPDQPTWLDGTHKITARVWDTANNSNISSPVTVTLDNNLFPIEFTSPSYASVWGSTDIPVVVSVSNLAAGGGTYEVHLSVDGGTAWLMTDLGSSNFGATLDGRTLTEGTRSLIATVQDADGRFQSTALDFDEDRTGPEIIDTSSASWIWINAAEALPIVFKFDVRDYHGFADSTSSAWATLSGSNGFSDRPAQWLSSTLDTGMNRASYSFTWSPPAAGYVGSIKWSANAYDNSSPPNFGELSTPGVISVDTVIPTIDAPVVSPALGSLITKTVTITTQLHDGSPAYPRKVHLEIWDVFNGIKRVDNGMFTDAPLVNVDALGNFTYTWNTAAMPDGPYVIRVGGWDEAGNEVVNWALNDYIYVVDNSRPVASWPYAPKSNNVVDGRVNVRYSVTDPFGIVTGVTIAVMADGENPNTDIPLSTETIALPFDTGNTTVLDTVAVDVSALPTADYDLWCRAADWAGNQSWWSGPGSLSLDRTYLTDAWGYYSRTGINYDVSVGGTLYEGGLPSVGSTIRLYYGVRPSGMTTYTYTNMYVSTDAAGAYSNEFPLNINAGDYFFVQHRSPQDNMVAFNNATVADSVGTNYTSYLPLGEQVRDSFIRFTEQPTLEYSLEVGGVLWDNAGPITGRDLRLYVPLYDSGGAFLSSSNFYVTTDGSGAFALDTWPLNFYPAAQRMAVYFYDNTNGKLLGYFYGNSTTYAVPGPMLPYLY